VHPFPRGGQLGRRWAGKELPRNGVLCAATGGPLPRSRRSPQSLRSLRSPRLPWSPRLLRLPRSPRLPWLRSLRKTSVGFGTLPTWSGVGATFHPWLPHPCVVETLIRVSRKIKSAVCLSAHLLFFSFWQENMTDFKSVDMSTSRGFSSNVGLPTVPLAQIFELFW
jgi:hypothetical protein